MIVKVKEPLPPEWPLLRRGQIVFTYFHFAADLALTEAVLASGATAVAYETLRDDRGQLPLLTPMSEVAGRMSIQEGAKYLERPQMGRGILLGGVPGVAPANITILGGGVVGANAAKVAAGFGANIGLLDVNMDRLRYLDDVMPPNVDCLFSDRHTIREQLKRADLVIGAVLIPGAKAPRLIEPEDLTLMQPGSVIIDVAIDQGGCVATSRPTTHSEPTYLVDQVLHYCVTKDALRRAERVPTYALCNVTLPWVLQIARRGLQGAAESLRPVARSGHQPIDGPRHEPAPFSNVWDSAARPAVRGLAGCGRRNSKHQAEHLVRQVRPAEFDTPYLPNISPAEVPRTAQDRSPVMEPRAIFVAPQDR